MLVALGRILALQSNDRLADYAKFCLDEGFNKSGSLALNLSSIGKKVDLAPYSFKT